MKRVTGIGGVFFKVRDKAALSEWYKRHLGIPMESWGAMFAWGTGSEEPAGYTVLGTFPSDSDYFAPSDKPFMINFRVDDLEALLKALAEEGVEIVKPMETAENGKFGWILDPEGTKIELWEPVPIDQDPYR